MTALTTDRFADRIALVTGAANGIGRASALRLAREGADLVVVDREGDTLQGVAREIEAAGRRVLPITADWTDPGAVEAAFAATRQRFGRIDILFNNVGQCARERATGFHLSEEATWRCVGIVNMSTESAFYGDVGFVDYAAAKMGVVGFTRSLARELAPFHVNVNAVCPGAIRTRAHDRLPKAVIDKVRTSVPMGYVAEPEDVAGVVAFLASDDARYITGQSILIDGGRWMI